MQAIALEFCRESGGLAVLGTDTILYLDRRWGTYRRREAIYHKVEELRRAYPGKYSKLAFAGYNVLGRGDYTPGRVDVRLSDSNPPAWVTRETRIYDLITSYYNS